MSPRWRVRTDGHVARNKNLDTRIAPFMGLSKVGRLWASVLLGAFTIAPGCSIAPKNFYDLRNPAPLVRARATRMGDRLPNRVVIPTLIDQLDDPDNVVRLSASTELKRRTGQDFGYVPWADPIERAQAVARWRKWQQGGGRSALAGNRQMP
jgi:hypothetical protein